MAALLGLGKMPRPEAELIPSIPCSNVFSFERKFGKY